ncbi:MAG: DUF4143 domain-containing protein [Propionibacteriaceae bacterium]|nr:DUF4143 domain-containing protein [Propionibacteriaceae bacterium]
MIAVLPAIAVEGAKGVGKTALARRRASTVFLLDNIATAQNLSLNPDLVLAGAPLTFIDEWQLVPPVWDVVRRAVDDGAAPGSFLLAGSATTPPGVRLHSGAGRIVRTLLRPMTIPERGMAEPSVSFAQLLSGGAGEVAGMTSVTTADYVDEILESGFPGIRGQAGRDYLLDSYLDRIVDHDIPEAGGSVRRPAALRTWLAAYAAATGTSASHAVIAKAASPGDVPPLSQPTASSYRELLQRIWVLDPLPAWEPGFAHLKRLGLSPKHHLVDPALAARLVGATRESLIQGDDPFFARDGTFLGALFESLAVQTIRVLADLAGAQTSHLRTRGGDHEIDIIVQRPDHRVLAIEVKLANTVRPTDVKHLAWLQDQLPGRVVDRLIVNTGPQAYRRPDGVAVVPLALLGA